MTAVMEWLVWLIATLLWSAALLIIGYAVGVVKTSQPTDDDENDD